jgi:putative ABC transport system permease protein
MDTLWLALRDLVRHPGRSLALSFLISVGVAGIFLFEGFNAGIMYDYRNKTIHGQTGNGRVLRKGYLEHHFKKQGEGWLSDTQTLENSLKSVEGVIDVYPRIRFPAFLTNGKTNVVGFGEGVDAEKESHFFNALTIKQGTLLTGQSDGAFLGEGMARSLQLHVGDPVTILTSSLDGRLNGVDLKVVGIFFTGVKSVDDSLFRIQLKQAQTLLETDKIETFVIGLKEKSPQSWGLITSMLSQKFPDLQAYTFEELDQAYYGNSVKFLDGQFGLILTIILLVVVLGVLNMISMSILQRQKEIAILRANGESSRTVMLGLMTEGVFIGIFGSVLGLLAAVFLNAAFLRNGIYMPPAPGFTNHYYAFVRLQGLSFIPWIVLGTLSTLFGSFLGAYRTVTRPLGDALREIGGAS